MFKKIHKLLIFVLLLISIYLPINIYAKEVILGGENIGIEINSKGIVVVGFYKIDKTSPGEQAGLKVGDRIIKVGNKAINKIDELSVDNDTTLNIAYIRNGKEYQTKIDLIKDSDNVYKTGIYVKNNVVGIGTLTFIDIDTKIYGALGHEIIDKSTKTKFEIKDGKIYSSIVTSIDKSTRNNPGEKNATINYNKILGTIEKNTSYGIYGFYENDLNLDNTIELGENSEIVLGEAFIKTTLDGSKTKEYKINITKINETSNTKNIVFEITDEELLKKTNGIVQGMSGSPIIQNNKLIGAVTHVFVDNPHKGYGIFINTMLKEANKRQ